MHGKTAEKPTSIEKDVLIKQKSCHLPCAGMQIASTLSVPVI
jgi:hypothetical protein